MDEPILSISIIMEWREVRSDEIGEFRRKTGIAYSESVASR